MATTTIRATAVIGTNGTTWTTTTNAVDGTVGTNPATYAVWTSTTSGATAYIELGTFNFASLIGASDTLNSVTVTLRHFESNTTRINSVTMQPYDGSTAIGSAFTCTRATGARDDTTTFPVTLAQLRSSTFKVRAFAGRAAVTQSATFNVDHVDVLVDYTPLPPAITQAAYRFYAEGSESGSTALASQDTAPSVNVSSDVALQLRMRLQSTNAGVIPATDDWQLQYEKNASGTWNNLNPSGAADVYDSPSLDNTAPSTNRLTGGTGTFVAGDVAEDGVCNDFGWSANNYTELVYGFQLKSADLANDDTLRFRVLRNGATDTMTYSVTPTINVTKAVPAITQAAYRFYNGSGTESGSTALASENTAPVGDHSNGADIFAHLRVRLQSTTAVAIPSTDDFQLQFNKNSAGWTNLTTSYQSGIRARDSDSNLTEGQATTNRLSAGSGSFVAGKASIDGIVNDLGWTANNYTELLYSLVLTQTVNVNGDSFAFRILKNDAVTDMTYSVTPTITVVRQSLSMTAYRFYDANGTESGGAALATQNTAYTVDVSAGNYSLLLRVMVQNNNSYDTTGTPPQWKLRRSVNGGGFVDVTNSGTAVLTVNAPNLTADEATTNRLTGGTGSFVAGKVAESVSYLPEVGLSGNNYTELLWAIQVFSNSVAHNDTITFRLYQNGHDANLSFPVTPTINVTKTLPSPPRRRLALTYR